MDQNTNCGYPAEGMVPFVVYGYPACGNMMMPQYGVGGMMSEERCGAYGMMNQYFPQGNVMNPMFFSPYPKTDCGCRANDLD